jgi:hypothetical protein
MNRMTFGLAAVLTAPAASLAPLGDLVALAGCRCIRVPLLEQVPAAYFISSG